MRDAWIAGQKVVKLIGFDATEDHRAQGGGGTFSTNGMGQNIAADPELPHFRDRYDVVYPLREWGMNRDACLKEIADAGLPVPPKSVCVFCPAMRQIEIIQLRETNPDLYRLSMAMEQIYRSGRHFLGDSTFTVKAKHKQTDETYEEVYQANSKADARKQFREAYDDESRPFKYTLSVSEPVRGLNGTGETWSEMAEELIHVPMIPEELRLLD